MAKQRRRFSPEEKVRILRRHFLDKVPPSGSCSQASVRLDLMRAALLPDGRRAAEVLKICFDSAGAFPAEQRPVVGLRLTPQSTNYADAPEPDPAQQKRTRERDDGARHTPPCTSRGR